MGRKPRQPEHGTTGDLPPASNSPIVGSLTERDRDILGVLTLRVRALSVAQAARTWWNGSPPLGDASDATRNAGHRLAALSQCGLVETITMLAHPEIDLKQPLWTWQPGLPPPNFGSIAHAAKTRWTQPSVSTELIVATTDAGKLMGGQGGRLPKASEATHDLHIAGVYLLMRRELRTRAESWRSEAVLLAERGRDADKLPDAMVRDGGSRTAIDMVGEYAPTKLAEFHEFCGRMNWGYELW